MAVQFTTLEKLRSVILGKGYRFFQGGQYNLNIVGIRTKNSESNSFDDFLLVAFQDKNFQWQLKQWAITTDPGKPWLLKPMDPKGCAVIVPGQYLDVYADGIHGRSKPPGRRYRALEQVGKMAYVRDNNKDSRIDSSLWKDPRNVFWDILKTNIHRSSQWAVTRWVETYSAGCQVFQSPKDFDEFMGLVSLAKIAGHNRFSYTLLMETDFA